MYFSGSSEKLLGYTDLEQKFWPSLFYAKFSFVLQEASIKVISRPLLSSLNYLIGRVQKTQLLVSVACVVLNDGLLIWLNQVAGRLVSPLHTD